MRLVSQFSRIFIMLAVFLPAVKSLAWYTMPVVTTYPPNGSTITPDQRVTFTIYDPEGLVPSYIRIGSYRPYNYPGGCSITFTTIRCTVDPTRVRSSYRLWPNGNPAFVTFVWASDPQLFRATVSKIAYRWKTEAAHDPVRKPPQDTTPPTISISRGNNSNQVTVVIEDSSGVDRGQVSIDPSTTASNNGLNCSQTTANKVTCTVDVTSNGNLTIAATDKKGNTVTKRNEHEMAPEISFISGLPTSNLVTVVVEDDGGINKDSVTIDNSATTAKNNGLSCEQTTTQKVTCTTKLTSSAALAVKAVDTNNRVVTASINHIMVPEVTFTTEPGMNGVVITIEADGGVDRDKIKINPDETTADLSDLSCEQKGNYEVVCRTTVAPGTAGDTIAIDATDNRNQTVTVKAAPALGPKLEIRTIENSNRVEITAIDIGGISRDKVKLDAGTTVSLRNVPRCEQVSDSVVACDVEAITSGRIIASATDSDGNKATLTHEHDMVPDITMIPTPGDTVTIKVTDDGGVDKSQIAINKDETVADLSELQCRQEDDYNVICSTNVSPDTNGDTIAIDATDKSGKTTTVVLSAYLGPKVTFIPSRDSNEVLITVEDSAGLLASSVSVDVATEVTHDGLFCEQKTLELVECNITLTSSGLLVISATDFDDFLETARYQHIMRPKVTFSILDSDTDNLEVTIITDQGLNKDKVSINPDKTTAETGPMTCEQKDSDTVVCTTTFSPTAQGDTVELDIEDNAGRDTAIVISPSSGPVIVINPTD